MLKEDIKCLVKRMKLGNNYTLYDHINLFVCTDTRVLELLLLLFTCCHCMLPARCCNGEDRSPAEASVVLPD